MSLNKQEQLTQPKSFFSEEDIAFFTDENNLQDINKHLVGEPSLRVFASTFKPNQTR